MVAITPEKVSVLCKLQNSLVPKRRKNLPWETLSPDAQMFVFDELWGLMGMVLVIQIDVQSAQRNRGESNEE